MTKWVIDASHTTVEFSIRHLMISRVKGRFSKVEGSVQGDPNNLTGATVQATIDAASVNTADEQRDVHLRSADFFDVENHPALTFESRSIERTDGNEYRMTGDLTIHGVTKLVAWTLTFEGQGKDPWGNERIAVTAQTRINRKDFNLTWNAALEAGGFLVGDQVDISVEAQAIKQQ